MAIFAWITLFWSNGMKYLLTFLRRPFEAKFFRSVKEYSPQSFSAMRAKTFEEVKLICNLNIFERKSWSLHCSQHLHGSFFLPGHVPMLRNNPNCMPCELSSLIRLLTKKLHWDYFQWRPKLRIDRPMEATSEVRQRQSALKIVLQTRYRTANDRHLTYLVSLTEKSWVTLLDNVVIRLSVMRSKSSSLYHLQPTT